LIEKQFYLLVCVKLSQISKISFSSDEAERFVLQRFGRGVGEELASFDITEEKLSSFPWFDFFVGGGEGMVLLIIIELSQDVLFLILGID
jgi:hypothetical protein